EDQTVRVWDAATGRGRTELHGHQDGVNSAAFSPNGRWIVTASDDGTARLWEAASGRPLVELRGHTREVTGAAFGPDGRQVVTASRDGTARLWVCELCGSMDDLL